MRKDLKELKELIKQTKADIEDSMNKGIDVGELREYYRSIVN